MPTAALLLAAGAIAAAVVPLWRRAAELVAAAEQERLRAVEVAAMVLGERFAAAAAVVDRAAAALTPWPAPAADARLDAIAVGPLAALVVLDDGRVVATRSAGAAWLGLRRDLPDGAQGVGPGVVQEPLLRRPVVYLTAAVPDAAGTPAATVLGVLPAAELSATLSGLPLDGTAWLVAPDGTRIGATPDPGVVRAGPDLLPAAEAAADGPALRHYAGDAGTPLVGAAAPVRDGWVLVVTATPSRSEARVLWAAAPGVLALAVGTVVAVVVLDRRRRRAHATARAATTRMLNVTGHELRTPLTVAAGMVQTLRRGRLPPERAAELLDTVQAHLARLTRAVERLLFAADLHGGTAVAVRAVDIAPAVQRAVEVVARTAPVYDIVADVTGPLQAQADPAAVERIVTELLDNAVRYSPADRPVRVTAARVGRWVRIVVEDEGVGLPAHVRTLFAPFTQGEPVETRVRDEGGMGLGLHIVASLVDAMGGRLSAEARDPGTRMVVELRAA